MAKVTNTTPIPVEQTFEVTLTNEEIKKHTEIASRLYMHRREIRSLLGLSAFDNSLDETLSLLLALNPEDPLDDIDGIDDEFLFMFTEARQ
jgi:hypothetical protein